MVILRSMSRHGRMESSYRDTLDEALRLAARRHNDGKIVDEIIDNNRRYNRQEILLMCDDLGLLR